MGFFRFCLKTSQRKLTCQVLLDPDTLQLFTVYRFVFMVETWKTWKKCLYNVQYVYNLWSGRLYRKWPAQRRKSCCVAVTGSPTGIPIQKPNSWTYNFLEVSEHNLESSKTWRFLYGVWFLSGFPPVSFTVYSSWSVEVAWVWSKKSLDKAVECVEVIVNSKEDNS